MNAEHSPTPDKRSSTTLGIVVASVLAVLVIAGASWWFLLRSEPYEFKYGYYDPAEPAPALTNAVDQRGEPFSFDDFQDKVLFVYFGYTHCPDACPATLAEFMDVKDELGDQADDVAFVMITVDPERDTPEWLGQYVGFWDPEFYGVSMPQEDIERVARDWMVTFSYEDKDSDGGYLVNHEVSAFVIDKDGNKRLTYPLGADTATMAADAKYLLQE